MELLRNLVLGSFVLALASGCATEDGADMDAGMSMSTLTTSSAEARDHVIQGVHLSDVGRGGVEAYEHFTLALEADPSFAYAELWASGAAPTLESSRAHLARAVELSPNASEVERLQIEIVQKNVVENDGVGALALAEQLVDLEPTNPRAWMVLAGQQENQADVAASRASLTRATEVAPDFMPAHLALANSYVVVPPVDFALAETHFQRAVALEPDEAEPLVRLAYLRRAQGQLQAAEEALTGALALAPDQTGVLSQRGHVNLFLGNYDAARADYDRAIALSAALPGGGVGTAIQRSLVAVHAGDPAAALLELQALDASVDGMGVADADGVRIGIYLAEAFIAAHSGTFEVADQAVARLATIWRSRAEQVGTDAFRRAREADIAFYEGLVAAYKGDYALASQKAQDYMTQMEPEANPRKNENAYMLQGLIALKQAQYADAVEHLERTLSTYIRDGGNFSFETYMFHLHGLALEGAGRTEEALARFRQVAAINFSTVGAALVRAEALEKAGM